MALLSADYFGLASDHRGHRELLDASKRLLHVATQKWIGRAVNRRQFFGMNAAALAAAGLPLALLPEKTIFLPPRSGWWAPKLALREVEQWTINDDTLWIRYDAAWRSLSGEHVQAHCDFPLTGLDSVSLSEDGMAKLRASWADQARIVLARYKPFAGRQVELELPRTAIRARYV